VATTLTRQPISGLSRSAADPRAHVDWGLIGAALVLCAFGLVAIYTATYQTRALNGLDTLYYVKRQGLAIVLGLVAMAVVMLIDYRKLRELALVVYGITLALLGALLLMGRRTNGIEAWFDIGPFQLQPSEMAKVVVVLVLAGFLGAERQHHRLTFPRFLGALVLVAIPAALVLAQPDLGTASVLVAVTMAVLLVAGAQPRHIALVTLAALVTAGTLVAGGTLARDQQARLDNYINQDVAPRTKAQADAQRQVTNSKEAIGSGGLLGRGYLDGLYTNGGFVAEQHTDFVFSAIAEQFGFAGSAVVLLLYGFVMLRIWRIGRLARDMLGTLIAVGALALLTWHVFENVGMTMGLMPVTGIPLPLLSYGGSAIIAFLVLLGMVESVHMRRFL
jgi:rod shape determining protein RodA